MQNVWKKMITPRIAKTMFHYSHLQNSTSTVFAILQSLSSQLLRSVSSFRGSKKYFQKLYAKCMEKNDHPSHSQNYVPLLSFTKFHFHCVRDTSKPLLTTFEKRIIISRFKKIFSKIVCKMYGKK